MMNAGKVVLASGNKGKLKELAPIFAELGMVMAVQSEFDVVEAEETGLSFVENAILKARNACAQTGLPALADDSGLEVDALKGGPGIYSARYAGDGASDADNNAKLLKQLGDQRQRSARFQCVLVYMRHEYDPNPLICQGTWEGEIATQSCGDKGFGYDPLFYIAELDCCSAQLSLEQKRQYSHRGKALAQLKQALQGA